MYHSLKQQDKYLFKIHVNSEHFIIFAPGKKGIKISLFPDMYTCTHTSLSSCLHVHTHRQMCKIS